MTRLIPLLAAMALTACLPTCGKDDQCDDRGRDKATQQSVLDEVLAFFALVELAHER